MREQGTYLLTAACYEHKPFINTPVRRDKLLDSIFKQFIECGMEIYAWVVLTNHYHVLVDVTNFEVLGSIFKQIHGSSSHAWNEEDNTRGCKRWYRYSDRKIRSLNHYYATINYIHYNPVKHGLVSSPYDWKWSSVHWYLESFGRDWLRSNWSQYPIRDYGASWDEMKG